MTQSKRSPADAGQAGALPPIVVLGAGGTGRYMAWIAERAGYPVAGFLDDDPRKQGETLAGHRVLGPLASWKDLPADDRFINSLYGPKKMRLFAGMIDALAIPETRWARVVDPSAVVSPEVSIAAGGFVAPGCVVEPGAEMGTLSVLLGNVYIAHDCRLEAYVACANSASVAGGVRVGARTYIGANATIREYTTIGEDVIVGMGAVVTKDISDRRVVVGSPARPMPTVFSEQK